jgi:hypothetical protein
MRASLIGLIIVFAGVGCRSPAIPSTGPGSLVGMDMAPSLDMDAIDMSPSGPDHGRGLASECALPDGSPVSVGDLATARKLLPGRWWTCSRTSTTLGPWPAIDFAGIELAADDSVTGAPSGGGRWYLLSLTAGGALERIPGADAQGIFLYNPLPGPDFEQIALEKTGQSVDYNASFTDGPRKLSLQGSSFSGKFVYYGP